MKNISNFSKSFYVTFKALFKSLNVIYSLFVVEKYSEIKDSFENNKENIEAALFINCCGCVDIVKLLNPNPEQKLFISDKYFNFKFAIFFKKNYYFLNLFPKARGQFILKIFTIAVKYIFSLTNQK